MDIRCFPVQLIKKYNAMKIAVIDIGTNSFILMIAKVTGNEFEVLHQYFEIPQLGDNLMIDNTISPQAIDNAIIVLKKFREIIENDKVDDVLPVATAVLRQAENRRQVQNILSEILGHEIKVISGDEEARLSYLGAIKANQNANVIDIGGGSTEVISGKDGNIIYTKSTPIGAVKIQQRFFPYNKYDLVAINQALDYIRSFLSNIDKETIEFTNELVGVGGTITTLAHILTGNKVYNRDLIHNYRLDYQRNLDLFSELTAYSPEKLAEQFGINPKRAKVLPAGQLILIAMQEFFEKKPLQVSTYGLRYGIIKNYIQ